jgi:hypothetical protein
MTVIVLVVSGPAWAQSQDGAQGGPRFSATEQIIIARNDALNQLLVVDPWAVRTIVDALVAGKHQAPPTASPTRKRQRDAGSVWIDPQRNPDLEVFQRASPEAAYDLFQLLKRAASGQPGPK